MAGIYIHIPFCRHKCHYCNFHLSASLKYKEDVVKAIAMEIEKTRNFLKGERVSTIYLGGGTPSLLSPFELDMIFDTLEEHYDLSSCSEVTIECNPDDIDVSFTRYMSSSRINRFSLGIQSFFDDDLLALHRIHNSRQSYLAMEQIQKIAGERWTVDLIYGLPNMTLERWQENLDIIDSFKVPHLSAYALTVEPKTALYHFIQKGEMASPDENQTIDHFNYLMDWAEQKGYKHYEISNFSLPGYPSKHNSAYWSGAPYLGIGPGAHSYNGENLRRWNVSNNPIYIRKIHAGLPYFEEEQLSLSDRFNEMVMTKLRLDVGVNRGDLNEFGAVYRRHFEEGIESFVESGLVIYNGKSWCLTRKGKFFADHIASELFVVSIG